MNSNSPIITVKNIGKKYNINHQQGGYITLRDIMTNTFKNPLKFLKRKTKNILGLETKEEFWALKDVNFEVMKGEVIGIIGRNGAGKSTLLKILSQITPPTTGEIRINGTVGSLLEVGTGFHPELTGRENIFLNGAILGMKKKEIVKKFDEIVKFADIEKFLDTPVKYYSSGMYVRLAFSVAAHMDTDILIIDEVLAVGDAEFQKKCLGKMEDITQKQGRTILFVSHNMGAIESLCKRVILLKNGQITNIGNTNKIISEYINEPLLTQSDNNAILFENKDLDIKLKKLDILDEKGQILDALNSGKPGKLRMQIISNKKWENVSATIGFNSILENYRLGILYSPLTNSKLSIKSPETYITCCLPKVTLMPGRYSLTLKVTSEEKTLFYLPSFISIDVKNGDFFGTNKIPEPSWGGFSLMEQSWISEYN